MYGGAIKEETLTKANGQDDDNNVSEIQNNIPFEEDKTVMPSVTPLVMKIMEDTFLSNV